MSLSQQRSILFKMQVNQLTYSIKIKLKQNERKVMMMMHFN